MKFEEMNVISGSFMGKNTHIIEPTEKKLKNPILLLKTEYWGAFPETEAKLIELGCYLCYIENDNRWGTDADLDRKAEFVKYVLDKYDITGGCVPVGMSCGGLFAIKFAAKYPELIPCMYIDAPVLNFMSCPCGFGIGHTLADTLEHSLDEILPALGLKNISELLAYRQMPLNKLPTLVQHRIPTILVAGDSDGTVPFIENGYYLQKAYIENNIPLEVHIKKGADHHPHGLNDPTPIINFIMKYTNNL